MKEWYKRIFLSLGIIAVIALPVACITEKQADDTKTSIDEGVAATDGVLDAAGLSQFKPLAHAAGGLAKWVVGMCVGAAGGAAATQHVHGGLPFVGGRRRRKQEEDAEWDALLDTTEQLAKVAPAISEAVGGSSHVAKQAQAALQIVGALKSKQPKPRRRKESPSALVEAVKDSVPSA